MANGDCLLSFFVQAAEVEALSTKLSKASVKFGPCESTVEPVLQSNHIQRQKYFGGGFNGNYIHHALQPTITHQLSHAHIELVCSRCPDLLPQALLVAERYKLMTEYADSRKIFSSSTAVDSSLLEILEEHIQEFMATARSQVVDHNRGNITPKLHLVEHHVVSSIRRFGVSLGLLGEQGGESIHAEFNLLETTFSSVVGELEKLKMVVNCKQHLLTTLPKQLATVPEARRRKKK